GVLGARDAQRCDRGLATRRDTRSQPGRGLGRVGSGALAQGRARRGAPGLAYWSIDPALTIRRRRARSAGAGRQRRECATITTWLTLLVLLQAATPSIGAERLGPGDVRIIAPTELQSAARAMADLAAEPHEWLGLGAVDVTPLTLVVVPDA